MYYRWGCFPSQSRVAVRLREIIRLKVIVRVEAIPYTVGSPNSMLKQCHIIAVGPSHIRVG